VMVIALSIPCALFAQQDQSQTPGTQPKAEMKPGHKHAGQKPMMTQAHKKMMAEHEQMMKEMDARLQEKVAAMDAAKGDQKIEAMAAVIKELVSQRQQMRDHMMKMREMRMGRGHHQMGNCCMKSKCPKGMQKETAK